MNAMPSGLETAPEQLFLACVLSPSICMLQPDLQDPAVVAVGFLEGKWLSPPLTPFVVSRKKTKALARTFGHTEWRHGKASAESSLRQRCHCAHRAAMCTAEIS